MDLREQLAVVLGEVAIVWGRRWIWRSGGGFGRDEGCFW